MFNFPYFLIKIFLRFDLIAQILFIYLHPLKQKGEVAQSVRASDS